ncbi:2-oxoglutarate dehydrogenase E1 component [Paenibacillus amylolyticus]|uniref:2-oxoglutarate dehydrogenase E1 component n=1 Tax=Paenibacillus amylolyticus TaxID=1451 RepID=A0A124DXB3_PAEAM|nr:2-oxoglutarate dehydrogenase E1 component [Paenibacillus amylolyticus]OMF16732.1 2-oxoglutarate dehydrogenase E1 component [Paenibacillus amylolyticus]GAS80539.1 2-oxoglutarate dehydrogenase, E1 component [Paenibacillus amylolyticus]
MTIVEGNKKPWESYYGPNMGYVQEQYELFTQDPGSVTPAYRELFEQWGAPPMSGTDARTTSNFGNAQSASGNVDIQLLQKAVTAGKLVWNIRTYGHLAADIDPLGISEDTDTSLLEPQHFELNEEDLKALPASLIWEGADGQTATGWDAIQRLRQIYTGPMAYEFSHVHEVQEREWLNRRAESRTSPAPLTPKERKTLLERLVEVEQFEDYLHKTFVGQKRFSIEGNDVLVPMLDEAVRIMAEAGSSHILMGMAHRGRLNVLAHVLGKPYSKIFSEFHHAPNKDMVPSEGSTGINYGWTGDVKYHMGANRFVKDGETVQARLTLANNPSHLEYVNPVVQGFARAAQDDRRDPGYPKQDVTKAATILMHGDAAFPGEGIVAETLNFKALPGYQNGGTIHIIVNNRLGFTTDSSDSRSTYYASDLAKGYEIPIVHVNADNPEACIAAIRMAAEYRNRFKKDFLIDLIGYRRYGHNETDDPETTQPTVYDKVKNHPTVSHLYQDHLKQESVIDDASIASIRDGVMNKLKEAYDQMKKNEVHEYYQRKISEPEAVTITPTAVPLENLRSINADLLKWPENFNVYPKLQRILQRRSTSLNEGEKVDWSLAETLAFATILADGKPIRISGQDAERATFAHRNLVLHDSENGAKFCPLHHLPQARASFAIYNSPLSEESVVGFEYGYNVYSPDTLVIWEAQFGDFANCAQVIFDQFVSAGRAKWSQKSSLVMLLPHANEGQGPEHTSARLERFLQLCAEDNMTVANLSSASQYFHLLRRQASLTETEDARPLVMMSPKSLIRNPRVASPAVEFSEGKFELVLEQAGLGTQPDRVERIILCSGKMAIDLEDAFEKDKADWSWLHIIRVEQLYPFPAEEIKRVLARFSNVKELVWVQEENKNMGAWTYMEPRLREVAPEGTTVRYEGRPEHASPSSGYQLVHSMEQQQIITSALKQTTKNNIPLGR